MSCHSSTCSIHFILQRRRGEIKKRFSVSSTTSCGGAWERRSDVFCPTRHLQAKDDNKRGLTKEQSPSEECCPDNESLKEKKGHRKEEKGKTTTWTNRWKKKYRVSGIHVFICSLTRSLLWAFLSDFRNRSWLTEAPQGTIGFYAILLGNRHVRLVQLVEGRKAVAVQLITIQNFFNQTFYSSPYVVEKNC